MLRSPISCRRSESCEIHSSHSIFFFSLLQTILSILSPTTLDRVASHCQKRHFSRNQLLLKQGDPSSHILFVTRGSVRCQRDTIFHAAREDNFSAGPTPSSPTKTAAPPLPEYRQSLMKRSKLSASQNLWMFEPQLEHEPIQHCAVLPKSHPLGVHWHWLDALTCVSASSSTLANSGGSDLTTPTAIDEHLQPLSESEAALLFHGNVRVQSGSHTTALSQRLHQLFNRPAHWRSVRDRSASEISAESGAVKHRFKLGNIAIRGFCGDLASLSLYHQTQVDQPLEKAIAAAKRFEYSNAIEATAPWIEQNDPLSGVPLSAHYTIQPDSYVASEDCTVLAIKKTTLCALLSSQDVALLSVCFCWFSSGSLCVFVRTICRPSAPIHRCEDFDECVS